MPPVSPTSLWSRASVALTLAFSIAVLVGCQEQRPATADSGRAAGWSHYGGDAGGRRHSPLDQITPANVDDLEVAWVYHHGDVLEAGGYEAAAHGGSPASTTFQNTPILVDDTLYICSPFNKVIALDAETGEERWAFDPGDRSHGALPAQLPRRERLGGRPGRARRVLRQADLHGDDRRASDRAGCEDRPTVSGFRRRGHGRPDRRHRRHRARRVRRHFAAGGARRSHRDGIDGPRQSTGGRAERRRSRVLGAFGQAPLGLERARSRPGHDAEGRVPPRDLQRLVRALGRPQTQPRLRADRQHVARLFRRPP